MPLQHATYTLSVCTCIWVDKVNGVIDCQMSVPLRDRSNAMIYTPAITVYFRMKFNNWLYDRQQCLLLSLANTWHDQNLFQFSPPPQTHCPCTILPLWFFLFPNCDWYISTIFPSPPTFSELFLHLSENTIRAKLYQSTTVLEENVTSYSDKWIDCLLTQW